MNDLNNEIQTEEDVSSQTQETGTEQNDVEVSQSSESNQTAESNQEQQLNESPVVETQENEVELVTVEDEIPISARAVNGQPEAIFIFKGGHINTRIEADDDRIPLDEVALQMLQPDVALNESTPSSDGTFFDFSMYQKNFCKLANNDEIFLMAIPPASVLRGMWIVGYNKVKDLQVEIEVVKGLDVWTKYATGVQPTGVAPLNATKLEYNFNDALMRSTYDAASLAAENDLPLSNFRNPNGLKIQMFPSPIPLAVNDGSYLRMKIIAMGDMKKGDGACNDANYPKFKIGAIYDRLCANIQLVEDNCSDCAITGCDDYC